ncbi:MAG TPA: indolepyruvate oxidoreductase subunit beta [Candidatus Aminicenantes bacterium]|nr:indolepyruvate oxidoreductase subunit beta [Candidatus Aminicenantes bacterium]HDT13700.1 indolepyruvate oxidoreductase subunit beta [Candidatus Aminicenantes bacterium]
MKQDIILAGVGGQGILSIAYVIDNAALAEGLSFKQAEVHGMAQRGGAVQSHMRLSNGTIWSDLIPRGEADMILSVEPLEALRYLDHLRPDGIVVSSSTPYRNIPDYPDLAAVLEAIRKAPRSVVVNAEALAKEAGTVKAQNIVLLGAASSFLVLEEAGLVRTIEDLFRPRGPAVLEANLKAFELGKKAARPQ